jgi:hypothetical protein
VLHFRQIEINAQVTYFRPLVETSQICNYVR